ncbi:MAG: glutamate 5-kinase [Saprospiraceae bacterium]|nr:glutamate 5-kinase [Saprospiraceae bacterium]
MIVIKVGTNVIAGEDGSIDLAILSDLVAQIANLKEKGQQIILVSSGAVGAGRQEIKLSKSLNRVERRQLWAAIGQPKLLQHYMRLFEKYQIHVAQILATKEDFRDRKHYLHMRNCFRALLTENVIPIVNENDVIAVDELMFTDNDELASLVAAMMGAEALYILTNVDGVYEGHPDDPGATLIRQVHPDSSLMLHFRSNQTSTFGRGGMATKFRMSRRLAAMGIDVHIANGKKPEVIKNLHLGKPEGTHFCRKQNISSVKKWIAYQDQTVHGAVIVNDGAKSALLHTNRAASLLPVGVISIKSPFEKGDLVNVLDKAGQIVALGMAQYGSDALEKYLGQNGHKALIHYDYMVITYERN